MHGEVKTSQEGREILVDGGESVAPSLDREAVARDPVRHSTPSTRVPKQNLVLARDRGVCPRSTVTGTMAASRRARLRSPTVATRAGQPSTPVGDDTVRRQIPLSAAAVLSVSGWSGPSTR